MLHEPDTSVFEVMSLILIEKGYIPKKSDCLDTK